MIQLSSYWGKKAPRFPLSVLLTDRWSSENWKDETTRCLLVHLLVHALRKKNLPQGNLSNLLSSPTNQVCHCELTTQVCHSFIALFFIIKPVLAYRCRGLVDLGLAVSGWVWFAHLMQTPATPELPPSTSWLSQDTCFVY